MPILKKFVYAVVKRFGMKEDRLLTLKRQKQIIKLKFFSIITLKINKKNS